MPINSKRKGSAGEREIAEILRSYGYANARRGQQFSGLSGDADVVGLPGYHIEVKRTERLNIDQAMAQSVRDADAESIRRGMVVTPVVMHRRNRKEWLVTMRLDDFMRRIENV